MKAQPGRVFVNFFERAKRLDPVADNVARQLNSVLDKSPAARRFASLLHGTWLGHPLHPVLTDVPLGAWTLAGVLDVLPSRPKGGRLGRLLHSRARRDDSGATVAIAVGLVAALPTAATGLTDWRYLSGATRRVGAGHALLNVAATLCYAASLGMRLSGTGPAKLFSYAGLGLVTLSGYLGGHLVFSSRSGVVRVAEEAAPEGRETTLPLADLPHGAPVRVEVAGFPVMLYRREQTVNAVSDMCTHMGCSLSEGRVEGETVICACHGSAFSLVDGHVVTGPSVHPLTVLRTSIDAGRVLIDAASNGSAPEAVDSQYAPTMFPEARGGFE